MNRATNFQLVVIAGLLGAADGFLWAIAMTLHQIAGKL